MEYCNGGTVQDIINSPEIISEKELYEFLS